MKDITVSKINEVHARIAAEPGVMYELSDHMTFDVPNSQHHPKVKAGVWDGKIRLIDNYGRLYGGLVPNLAVLATDLGYTLDIDKAYLPNKIDEDEIVERIAQLNLPDFIEVEDFQYKAVFETLRRRRLLVISPTSSGKSLITYMLTQLIGGRSLIIVPTVILAKQLVKDMKDYGYAGDIHMIAEGGDKNSDAPITVSTWQSIYKQPSKYFSQYDNMFADEVHRFEAKSCREMTEKMPNTEYRIGLTGSLKGTKTHELMLTGIFGPKITTTTTRELIDRGFVSDISIVVIVFKHPPETQALLKPRHTYREEDDLIIGNERRNRYIRNLVGTLKGNGLVLYRKIGKHGDLLLPILEELGRKVHYVNGTGKTKEAKNNIAAALELAENDIGLTSSGVFATGVSINNIQWLLLSNAIKSQIDLLQSMGRVLRKDGKDNHTTMFDLADLFRRKGDTKNPNGYSYRHLQERLAIYAEQQLNYKVIEVQL